MCLTTIIATIDWAGYGAGALAILAAAAGLGFIIFVHELGHFLVAKACGVKCDKFMIGFDIGGYKIGKQIGETYYGIGILPLGGYVRMLGQNDDPRMNEEQIRESEASVGQDGIETKEIIGPGGEKHVVDARSYIAKSVPQRMAIISAGVVMNVIFAFIFAFIAFRIGVPSMPCIVSGTDPGAPAWEAGLRADDVVTRIDDIENPWYDQLRNEVMLASKGEPVEFEVTKAATGEPEVIVIEPSRKRLKIAQIGVAGPLSLTLNAKDPTRKFSPADAVKDRVPAGSRIVAAGGQAVDSYGELQSVLAASASESLTLELAPPAKKGTTPASVAVEIAPNQAEYVGLVMKMGPITAIQQNSPAAQSGLEVGDRIVGVNGKPVGMLSDGTLGWDPRTLGDKLSAMGRAGETVELEIVREGSEGTSETRTVPLRSVDWFETPFTPKSPDSAPALGVAYYLLREVDGVVPGSPASKADIQPGDEIVSARLIAPEKYSGEYKSWEESLVLSDEQQAWAHLLSAIQDVPPGSQLELAIVRGDAAEPQRVKVGIAEDFDSFTPHRGVALTNILENRSGATIGEQASMAWNETKHALTSVYRFLNRIIGGDIPATALGGPITIAKASYFGAMEGAGRLLLFLTLISANLAVVNFLPIPVLDGGHMVFLAYEAIFRRPANEYIAGIMNLAGLAFIVCLMLFVFGLDLNIIPRNL